MLKITETVNGIQIFVILAQFLYARISSENKNKTDVIPGKNTFKNEIEAYLQLLQMIRQALQKAIVQTTDPRLIKCLQEQRKENSQKLMQGRKQSQSKVRTPSRKQRSYICEETTEHYQNQLSQQAYLFPLPRRRLVADKLFLIDFSEL